MNGYTFTEGVRKALSRARAEAGQLGHEYVGPEHMLLGVVLAIDPVAAGVLTRFQVDPSAVEREILRRVKRGNTVSEGQDLPYTARAKRSLEFAMTEALHLRAKYVGNEHILLGLMREEKSIACEVLVALGVTLDGTRDEIRRLLGDDIVATGSEWMTELGVMTRQLADSLVDVKTPRSPEDLLLVIVSDQCGARHLLEVSGVDIASLQGEIHESTEVGKHGVREMLSAAKGEQKFLEDCALASHHLLLAYLALRPAHGYRALSERGVTHASVRVLAEKIFG